MNVVCWQQKMKVVESHTHCGVRITIALQHLQFNEARRHAGTEELWPQFVATKSLGMVN